MPSSTARGGTTAAAAGGDSTPSASTFGNSPLSSSRSHAISAFLAGDEPIAIVPTFNYKDKLGLISQSVGPFQAGVVTVVPLWLAVHLRRRRLARIIPPEWMEAGVLREVLRFERDPNEASFSKQLPFRHAEIARAVLSATGSGAGASGDGVGGGGAELPDADVVKILLEDIAAVRRDKIRRNVHTLSAQTLVQGSAIPIIDVSGMGSLEMHAVRPFIAESFKNHGDLTGRGTAYRYPPQPSASGNRMGSAAASAAASRRRVAPRSRRPPRVADDDEPGVLRDETEEGQGLEDAPDEEPPSRTSAPNGVEAGRSRIRRFR